MTVRIGWTRDRERARDGRIAGGLYLLEIAKVHRAAANHFVVGFLSYRRADLDRLAEKGVVMDLRVIGALRFADDVTPASIERAIGRVNVTGPIIASDVVKAALARHTATR